MKLIIEDDQGRRTVVPMAGDEITIGRNEQNVVTLAEKNVSRRHGRLFREAGRIYIEDLRSLTGIRVNGERILGRRPVEQGDLIQISEYDLMLEPEAGEKREAEGRTSAGAQERADGHGRALTEVRPADVREGLAEAVEVPRESRARLVGISGTYRGTALVLDRTPIRIGSSSENDIVVHHPSISRRHLRLHLEGGAWKVLDAEPRNGVRVNGEPSAGIALRHGDVMEMGHVRFAFADAGRELELPREFAPISMPKERARRGSALPAGTVVGLAALLGAGALLLRQPSGEGDGRTLAAEPAPDPAAERALALRSAEEDLLAHRYAEAQRHFEAARRAGATGAELKDADSVQEEARGETLVRDLEVAVAARDWERARELASALRSSRTWYGERAMPLAQAATAGYVATHLARAGALQGKNDPACLAEAQLALDADAKSAEAAKLARACGARRVLKASVAAAPASAPGAVRSARPSDDALARKLAGEGNRKLTAQDFPAAIALYQQALVLKPGKAVLASLYRGMGVA
ncbi:MAG TPA: FHA domain-containing protein, partial [Myxococcales bacterium]|nr:FHA domain-containing protein [Myxococcales bacterium]